MTYQSTTTLELPDLWATNIRTPSDRLAYYIRMRKSSAWQALLWLLPTGTEVLIYAVLSFITLAISNLSVIKELFLLPDNFTVRDAVLGSFQSLLEHFIGKATTYSLVTYIFWAIVGISIYGLWWVLRNFSTELGNNLATVNFVRPKTSGRYEQLRRFIKTSLFQLLILVIFIAYINLIFSGSLAVWTTKYSALIQNWPRAKEILNGVLTLLAEIVSLHGFVILTRFLTLRKRVFGGYSYD